MSGTPSQAGPRLADSVRACVVGDQLIFLDLQRSRYVGIGGSQVQALSAAILQPTTGDSAPATPGSPGQLDEWMRRLRSQQLVSDSPSRQIRLQPKLPEPTATLDADQEPSESSDWRGLPRLWRSTWVVSSWLRRRTLADIASRVAALGQRHSGHAVCLDAAAMRAAVGVYLRLRPFALTSHDRCLNDSLTLVHFLAGRGMFPHWVIGVRVHPFAAHSWVQCGDVVLNDLAEHVRAYRPILIV